MNRNCGTIKLLVLIMFQSTVSILFYRYLESFKCVCIAFFSLSSLLFISPYSPRVYAGSVIQHCSFITIWSQWLPTESPQLVSIHDPQTITWLYRPGAHVHICWRIIAKPLKPLAWSLFWIETLSNSKSSTSDSNPWDSCQSSNLLLRFQLTTYRLFSLSFKSDVFIIPALFKRTHYPPVCLGTSNRPGGKASRYWECHNLFILNVNVKCLEMWNARRYFVLCLLSLELFYRTFAKIFLVGTWECRFVNIVKED